MSLGMIFLIGISVLILVGVSQRVLDRLRLNDKVALAFVVAIIVGGLLPDINITNIFGFNIGGFLVPFALAVYLFVKADTGWERTRSVIAALIAGVAIYFAGKLLPHEPEAMLMNTNYLYAILGGVIAYLFGRSRRAAFIAGIVGMIIADVIQLGINYATNIQSPIILGGGGGFGSTVIAGILAVLIAEVIGETREKLQGGTAKKHMHFEHSEFASSLGTDEDNNKDNNKDNKIIDINKNDNIINIQDKCNQQNDGGEDGEEDK
jgi:uncharacterized membrane protein